MFVYTVTRKFEQSQVELVWLPFVSFVKLEDELLLTQSRGNKQLLRLQGRFPFL